VVDIFLIFTVYKSFYISLDYEIWLIFLHSCLIRGTN